MSMLVATKCAPFTLAQLEDDNALVTAVATSVTAVTYSAATMDGALANPGPAAMRLPQYVRVETTAVADCYNTTDAILFTGTLDGETVTGSITLTKAGGNEALDGDQAFDTVVSIAVPAQLKATGQFKFGVTDIAFSRARPCIKVVANAAGDVVCEFFDGDTETVPMLQGARLEDVAIKRIIDASTTAEPIVVYVGRSHV